ERRLPGPARRPELVEAQPADHRHEPAPHVLDLVDVAAQQAGIALLHHVLRLTQVAEHPQRDVEHVAPVLVPGAAQSGVRVGVPAAVVGLAAHRTLTGPWSGLRPPRRTGVTGA